MGCGNGLLLPSKLSYVAFQLHPHKLNIYKETMQYQFLDVCTQHVILPIWAKWCSIFNKIIFYSFSRIYEIIGTKVITYTMEHILSNFNKKHQSHLVTTMLWMPTWNTLLIIFFISKNIMYNLYYTFTSHNKLGKLYPNFRRIDHYLLYKWSSIYMKNILQFSKIYVSLCSLWVSC